MNWAEPVAVTLALAYVVFAIKERRFAWVLAAASAALYLRIFFVVGLFMEAGLQLFYILMAVYGWVAWGRDSRHSTTSYQALAPSPSPFTFSRGISIRHPVRAAPEPIYQCQPTHSGQYHHHRRITGDLDGSSKNSGKLAVVDWH